MSHAQSGLVFSAYLIGSAASSLLLVPLTDRVSPRRVLMASATLVAIANLLFPLLARGFWTGAILRFLAGAGHVGAYIPGIQIVSLRYAGAYRGTAVGVFVSIGYAGTTFSYVLMGWLLALTASWRGAYGIAAVAGLAGLALALWFAREPAGEPAAGSPPRRWALDWEALKSRPVALVIAAYALHTAELYLARLWFPLLLGAALQARGRDPAAATALATSLSGLMFMMGIPGVFAGGYLSDRWGRSTAAACLFAASGACSFVVGWLVGSPFPLLAAIGFLYGFATAADSAIYSTAVTELSPRHRIGSTQAVQSFIGFTVGAGAPVMAGLVLDRVRSLWAWGAAFSGNGVLALLGILALLGLRRVPETARMAGGKG